MVRTEVGRARICHLVAAFALGLGICAAEGAVSVLDTPKTISVPKCALGDALRLLAKQADLQILFAPALVQGRTAPAVSGTLSSREALSRLLSGTDLAATEQRPGVIVVMPPPAGGADAAASRQLHSAHDARTGPSTSRREPALEEVVVTAQRRVESLQSVPISLTVYNQATIDAQGIRSIDDLARLTPGITFTRSANNNNSESSDIVIRGISSNAGAATTGVYIDDTPIQGRHLSFPSFNTYPALFDIERVEVLRGPQGTLFGAGSEGGTIRFISSEPTLDRASVYARSELAATSHGDPVYEAGAAWGVPIVDERLAFRASMSYRYEGGYVDRIDWHTERILDKNGNASKTITARLALKWAMTEALSVMPSVFYQKRAVDDTSAWWSPWPGTPDPTNGMFNRPFRSGNTVASPNNDEFKLAALRIDWIFGGMQLISNTSYFKRDQSAITDFSEYDRAVFLGNPYPPAGQEGSGFWGDGQRNWTEEVRVQSADPAARVSWTGGLFYQRARENTTQRVYDPSLQLDVGVPANFGGGFIYIEDPRVGVDRQLAAFGQADIRITHRLKATLGLRYADAKFDGEAHYPESLVVGSEVTSTGSEREHPVTPRIGLEYQLNREELLYLTAAKGFRIGGVNAKVGQFCYGPGNSLDLIGLKDVPPTYNSDSLWSYEVGTKNSLIDNRLLIDASAYLIDWKDIQQNVALGCGFQFTSNLGRARSKGFDLQAVLKAAESVSLGGTFGYTDARFTRTVQLVPTVQSTVRNGDHLASSPWTIAVFGQVNFPVRGRLGYARADYQYSAQQSDRVPGSDPFNGGYAPWYQGIPVQSFASVRTGVTWAGLDVSLYAQNVFDTRPRLTDTQDIAAATGGTPLFYVITWRPRTFGLTATYHY